VSSPYEAPEQPEVNLDTTACSVTESVEQIVEAVLQKLRRG
jgi:adenylylsulfate kinase-like enzyme